MIGLRHRNGIFCQEGSGARRAQLERLRGVGRDHGPEELRSKLQNFNRDEVRELALEAGLRVRKDRTATWLPVGELRTALLEHLEPQRSAAAEEFAAFVLCFLFFCLILQTKHGHIERVVRVLGRHGRVLYLSATFPHTTWVRAFSRATGCGRWRDYIGCFERTGFRPTGTVRGPGVPCLCRVLVF